MTAVDPTARPRVLHCITRLGLGGAEAVALSIVQGLHDSIDFGVLAVRGVEDSAIGRTMRRELERLRVPLFCGPNLSQKFGGMILAGGRAAQVSRQFQPSIVHLHTEIPEACYAAAVSLPFPSPLPAAAIVRTIHNSVYWHFWPRLGRWCERRMRRSHLVCVSADAKAAAERFRQGSGAGPLPTAPVVIYNGVAIPEGSALPRREPGRPLRLLFAGRFEYEKGADLLPAIFGQVRAPAGGAELMLHGQGTSRRLLQALAANPPSGWKVRLEPPVANLPARMREFDLVIMPSRFEGLGLVAVEATLAGLPVVATDAPGLREALPADHPWRGQAGDASSFAASLQRALDRPDTWAEGVARAQQFARVRFDPQVMWRSYREVYQRAPL